MDKPGASPRNARAWRRVEEFLEWRIQFNQLDAAVPALRASSPDRRHFWRAFTARVHPRFHGHLQEGRSRP
ncbi:hypothetical protein F7R02_25720 [Xanthomonas cissicola]|nr:hypothetical protein F7R02_25720 [Xanthomonas cissicola]